MLALKVQGMFCITKEARGMRARMDVPEELTRTKSSMRRTVDVKVVAEQACSERAEQPTRIAQLEGVVYELRGELKIFWNVAIASLIFCTLC